MPVRLRRRAEMSIAVIMTSEDTAMVEPVETSHCVADEYSLYGYETRY